MRIGLGGGCHWCTEAVFQTLRGVMRVEQGFIRSSAPYHAWSEAVIVHFDAAQIGLDTLLEVHLRTHAATRQHSLREKYRSAVYAFDKEQLQQAQEILACLQTQFAEPLITRVLPFDSFRPSAARFHNYYRSNPQRPFCRTYIDPKLALIRKQFADKVAS
jgi:peptide-methionine (S)-S-oxide reductase